MGQAASQNYVRSLPQETYTPEYFAELYSPLMGGDEYTGPAGYARMGLLDIAPTMEDRQKEEDFLRQNLAFRMSGATIPSYFSTPPDLSDMFLLGPLPQTGGLYGDYQAERITPQILEQRAAAESAAQAAQQAAQQQQRQQQAQRRRLTPQEEFRYQVLDPMTEAERRISPPGGQMKWTWEGGSKYIDDYGNVAVLSEGGD